MWFVWWWGYIAFWTTVLYVLTQPPNRVHNLRALPEADNVVDAVSLFLKEQRRSGP